tara:strand:- start:492 stop:773 length:282 start_codon:yes stop_codon:yes gene_type:complete
MKKTFNLFLVSIIILLSTLIIAAYWDYLGFGENKTPLAFAVTLAFGVSIAGLILGISEIKKNKTFKTVISLVGHIIVLLFFILTAGYALMTPI